MYYRKTDKGLRAYKTRSSALSARHRLLFLMLDNKTLEEASDIALKLGLEQDAVDELERLEFLTKSESQAEQTGPVEEGVLRTIAVSRNTFSADTTVRLSSNRFDRFTQARQFMLDSLSSAGVSTDNSGIAREINSATQISELKHLHEGFLTLIESIAPAKYENIKEHLWALLQ